MPNSGDGIRLRSSARTSVGQVRENNEDSVHLWPGEQFVLAVVADGMGGAAAGEEASRMAIEAIQAGMSLRNQNSVEQMNGLSDDDISKRLRESIQDANLNIMKRAVNEPDMRGMGTTVTLAFMRDTHVIIAHVGDSRAYQVSNTTKQISQITSDHSFVEALLAAGHITPEQAEDHPMRNVLYRALGQAEDVDVDIYQADLAVGDRLVLCSDGLTRHVKPQEIAELTLADPNPSQASQRLIDLANERGGEDNVSVIIILVDSDAAKAQTDQLVSATAGEDNAEDTLVLKEKPFTRSSVQQRQNLEAPQESATPDEARDAPNSLSKQKMQAERISDSAETPAADSKSSSEAGLMTPDPIMTPVTDQAQPSGGSREADGEGHDTRAPEQ